MIEAERGRELNLIVTDLAEELDVPESKYEDANNRYKAVGQWLNLKFGHEFRHIQR